MKVMIYEKILLTQRKELENIIAWYFNDYLKDTFSADGFSDTPDAFILLYFAISCSESCIVIAPVSAVWRARIAEEVSFSFRIFCICSSSSFRDWAI